VLDVALDAALFVVAMSPHRDLRAACQPNLQISMLANGEVGN
jgi:hypothetical protein